MWWCTHPTSQRLYTVDLKHKEGNDGFRFQMKRNNYMSIPLPYSGGQIISYCPTKTMFKCNIAIKIDNGNYNYRRNGSLKGLENTLTLFLYLNSRPLKA